MASGGRGPLTSRSLIKSLNHPNWGLECYFVHIDLLFLRNAPFVSQKAL